MSRWILFSGQHDGFGFGLTRFDMGSNTAGKICGLFAAKENLTRALLDRPYTSAESLQQNLFILFELSRILNDSLGLVFDDRHRPLELNFAVLRLFVVDSTLQGDY